MARPGRKPIVLTPEQERVIRTRTAVQARDILGLSLGPIYKARNRLGLKKGPRGAKPKPWTPEELAVLGTLPDHKASFVLEKSHSAVIRKRHALNIPAHRQAVYPGKFPEQLVPLLGTMTDGKLAKLGGVSHQRVAQLRQRAGIKAFVRPPFVETFTGKSRYGSTVTEEVGGKCTIHCRCGREFARTAGELGRFATWVCGKCGTALTANLTGREFHRLTAREYPGEGKWRFDCKCGNTKVALGKNVERGFTKSCGCLQREWGRQAIRLAIAARHGRKTEGAGV
jgi:hypothetical protein